MHSLNAEATCYHILTLVWLWQPFRNTVFCLMNLLMILTKKTLRNSVSDFVYKIFLYSFWVNFLYLFGVSERSSAVILFLKKLVSNNEKYVRKLIIFPWTLIYELEIMTILILVIADVVKFNLKFHNMQAGIQKNLLQKSRIIFFFK